MNSFREGLFLRQLFRHVVRKDDKDTCSRGLFESSLAKKSEVSVGKKCRRRVLEIGMKCCSEK